MHRTLLKLPRPIKVSLEIAFDAAMFVLAGISAYSLSLGGVFPALNAIDWRGIAVAVPLSVLVFYWLGIYRSLLRFTSTKTLTAMLVGIMISTLLFWASAATIGNAISFPIATNYFFFATSFTMCGRFIARAYFRRQSTSNGAPVLIYGAKDLGRQLLASLQQGTEFNPVGLIDTSADLMGTTIGGVGVYHPSNLQEIVTRKNVKVVFIATSDVPRRAQWELTNVLNSTNVKIQQIPAVSDILSGRAKITDFQEVKIEALLGRKPVAADPHLLKATTFGQSVLITGAGGSIGSEISRQVVDQHPKRLVLFEFSEFALYSLEQELLERTLRAGIDVEIVPILGNVCDQLLLEDIFLRYAISTVFHTAAFKHVPILEGNIIAAVHNNVFGTKSAVEAAINTGVQHFTMVSTDKAVRPSNVMGATKRLAELVCQAHANRQSKTTISMVRFGNVLDSSGSVIPRFRDQISKGTAVTITHKEITRYFMTIPEASQLVVQSSGMASGGDVFLLDMGQPIKILDLAKSMIRLSGYTPILSWENDHNSAADGDGIEIVCTGLRPGEKLYEELLIGADALPTAHQRIKRAVEQFLHLSELEIHLKELEHAALSLDVSHILKILKRLPLNYSKDNQTIPSHDIDQSTRGQPTSKELS